MIKYHVTGQQQRLSLYVSVSSFVKAPGHGLVVSLNVILLFVFFFV